jgi:Na+-transporting methylmalonyl-CoA/oxaloacetate decarboxylase gamma subunit
MERNWLFKFLSILVAAVCGVGERIARITSSSGTISPTKLGGRRDHDLSAWNRTDEWRQTVLAISTERQKFRVPIWPE